MSTISPRSKVSTRKPRRRSRPARRAIWGIEAGYDDARKALGVSDDLKTIEGVTTPMLVKLGENEVRTVEDLAGCATDDLVGWTEREESGEKKHAGYLSEFGISREDADAIIVAARVRAGWIDAAAPAEAPAVEEDAE